MLTTRFTELVGCSVQIQQAGIGALAPPELAAAVSEAGGLGMLGMVRHSGATSATLGAMLTRQRAELAGYAGEFTGLLALYDEAAGRAMTALAAG